MSESKTPRTDAKARYPKITDGLEHVEISWKAAKCGCSVPASFARQLETELNEANEELTELKRQIAEGELIPLKVVCDWYGSLTVDNQPDIQEFAKREAQK